MKVVTRALIGFLSDLIQTADRDPEAGSLGAVLVHTGRGAVGVGPGSSDLLCGASTDRFVAGHCYVGCDGQLHGGPSLWALRDCASVIAVFKASAKADEFHAVVVSRVGTLVTVAEDPNLFDDGLALSFAQQPLARFPGPTLYGHLDRTTADRVEVEGGRIEPALVRTDVAPGPVSAFVKVADRRRAPIELYRTHQREAILVQIGPQYRGVLMPVRYEADGDERRPGADVQAPDITDLIARMQAEEDAAERRAAPAAAAEPPQELDDLFTAASVPEPAPPRTLDDVLIAAAQFVIDKQAASVSQLQRKLRVGAGPAGQGDDREVLMSAAELDTVTEKIRSRGAES